MNFALIRNWVTATALLLLASCATPSRVNNEDQLKSPAQQIPDLQGLLKKLDSADRANRPRAVRMSDGRIAYHYKKDGDGREPTIQELEDESETLRSIQRSSMISGVYFLSYIDWVYR